MFNVDHDDKTEETAVAASSLRAADHGPLPVTIPNLEHLTTAELTALRGYVTSQVRDARKKSNQLLNKDPEIRKLWMNTISFKPGATDDEKRVALTEFNRAILRHPPTYLAYAYVTSLFVIEEAVREEMNRRCSNDPKPKKK